MLSAQGRLFTVYDEGTIGLPRRPARWTLIARDAFNGVLLWKRPARHRNRWTIAAGGERLCFTSGTELVCLSMTDGSELWRNTAGAKQVIMSGEMVLAGNTAFSAQDGKKRCRVKGDLLAAGLIWSKVGMTSHAHPFHWAPREATATGYDPLTGEKKKVVTVPRLVTPGHHFRCYPPKATDRYILMNKRGVEFLDLRGDNHMRHDWLRAPCRHGALPANGLLYMSTSPCFCYPGVKLNGINTLSEKVDDGGHHAGKPKKRLHRGPAYGTTAENARGTNNWPTYRHDALRSGAAGTAVPADLGLLWETTLDRRLTPPVAAGGRVFCAAADRLVTIFGQLESAWPIHGSVLHQNGKLYLSAGRSSYLDGGMHYFALEPETGTVLHEARVASRRPDRDKDPGLPYDMEGTRTDVLVGDGEDLYQFFVRFNPDLTRQETPRITKLGDRRVSRHLMSNAGLLDRTWFDRNFWIHGTRWPGFYFAYDAPKSGQILIFDADTTYGLHVYRHRSGHSPIFEPGSGKYELFADESAGRAVLRPMEMGREKGSGTILFGTRIAIT